MTKQALRELRDKVAAGKIAPFTSAAAGRIIASGLFGDNPMDQGCTVCLGREAHNGSLDAAVAFLEAVLPGSDWVVRTCDPNEPDAAYAHTWLGDHPSISGVHHEYWADTPARALLLATLDALIARAGE